MRTLPLMLATALLLAAAPAQAAPRTFTVEPDKHSPAEASFLSKAMIVKFHGRTTKVSGEAQLDPNDVAKASGTVSVDLASLDTGIELRNEHMRGTLETEKFPQATYKFTGIKVPGNKLKPNAPVMGTATGTITIHGITKPLNAPVELTLLPEQDAKYRPGDWVHISSTFRIKMTDHDLMVGSKSLGVRVADELEIEIDGMARAK